MKARLLIIIGIIITGVIIASTVGTMEYQSTYNQNCNSDGGKIVGFLKCIYINEDFAVNESVLSLLEKSDLTCHNAIFDWLDVTDRLDPIPEDVLVREELFKQKNDATITLLNRCDVESLTVEEIQKLRSWEKENEN